MSRKRRDTLSHRYQRNGIQNQDIVFRITTEQDDRGRNGDVGDVSWSDAGESLVVWGGLMAQRPVGESTTQYGGSLMIQQD
jgi:hypothetical protein